MSPTQFPPATAPATPPAPGLNPAATPFAPAPDVTAATPFGATISQAKKAFGNVFGGFGFGGMGAPLQQQTLDALPAQQAFAFGGAQSRQQRRRDGRIRKLKFAAADDEALAPGAPEAKLVGLIVTIWEGSSYDELFKSVKPVVGEGERTASYAAEGVDPAALRTLVEFGADSPLCQTQGEEATQLARDLAELDPASVVFNWECCEGCQGDSFRGPNPVPLMAFLLSRGFMVMASDFSLGALIKQWDPALLGPNPFQLVGQFSDSCKLRFEPATLCATEDSAQLQVLGELCAKGEAPVHALCGTRAFAVDASVRAVRVLTVVSELGGAPAREVCGPNRPELLSKVGEHEGLCGHCIVDDFEGGGKLLMACPHWIELSRLDAESDTVLRVAEQRFGSAYAEDLRGQYEALDGNVEAVRAFSSAQASAFVQQSSAAYTPSNKKSSYSKKY